MLQVWIKDEEEGNPIKLTVSSDCDVADLINCAAQCGEFDFLVNKTKNYNVIWDNQILPRDDIVKTYRQRRLF